MRSFAVSAVGRDRPGIVAAITAVLLEHAMTVEDAQGGLLRGYFALTMLAAGGEHVDADDLQRSLDLVRDRLGLEAAVVQEVEPVPREEEPGATHAILVRGLDRPGVLHAVCAKLADAGATITALRTRTVEPGPHHPPPGVRLEVHLDDRDVFETVAAALDEIEASTETEIHLEPLLAEDEIG